MSITCCFIKKQYFIDNGDFVKMLDNGNYSKQANRSYFVVKLSVMNNNFYIPLRSNLGNAIKPYGRIGHQVLSLTRPNAGLDYRYTLIVTDEKYIEIPTTQRIPDSQMKVLIKDAEDIKKEFKVYLKGFIKNLHKNRIEKEPLYRESSLINYKEILSKIILN